MQEISAGGVVFRWDGEQVRFLLIADRYGRWTLPKGKREAGETEEETALREIEEETGIKGEIITFLQKTTYTYTHPEKGLIAKEVHYFLVKAVGGESKPQLTEITGVDWFSAEEAWKLQQEKGYENNREVLAQAFQALKVKKIDEKEFFQMQPNELAKIIDHTLLKPEATEAEIDQLCQEAVTHQFASVCVNPSWVSRAAKQLQDSNVKVCTVIGFPLGATSSQVKAFEAKEAIRQGAEELDMVLHIGKLKAKDQFGVQEDIAAVVKAAEGKVVKVILETALLTKEEIKMACLAAKEAGAHFVKTSTGFSSGGATLEDVRLMREIVGSEMGVKASGGIRDVKTALEMVAAGATRIGASASVAIITGGEGRSSY